MITAGMGLQGWNTNGSNSISSSSNSSLWFFIFGGLCMFVAVVYVGMVSSNGAKLAEIQALEAMLAEIKKKELARPEIVAMLAKQNLKRQRP
jgi:hypothetical protein